MALAQPGEAAAREAPGQAAPTVARQHPVVYRSMVRREASLQGLPPDIADAVMRVESSYDPLAIGEAGEIGLMQIMPPTARLLGFAGSLAELAVPETNVRYGVAYLSQAWRLAEKDLCTTVMKYRAGHNETRFSYRSVDYCLRVRAALTEWGIAPQGTVPRATFGLPVAAGGGPRLSLRGQPVSVRIRGRKHGRYDWRAHDSRVKVLTGRMTGLSIMAGSGGR